MPLKEHTRICIDVLPCTIHECFVSNNVMVCLLRQSTQNQSQPLTSSTNVKQTQRWRNASAPGTNRLCTSARLTSFVGASSSGTRCHSAHPSYFFAFCKRGRRWSTLNSILQRTRAENSGISSLWFKLDLLVAGMRVTSASVLLAFLQGMSKRSAGVLQSNNSPNLERNNGY